MLYTPYIIVLLLWTVNGAPIPPCPDGCTCKILEDSQQELSCTNLNFVDNLNENDLSLLTSLHLRNLNITRIENRLNKLNELLELDLAHNQLSNLRSIPNLPKLKSINLNNNHIKDITAEFLPKTLSNIDISNNKINYVPRNFLDLKNLKSLYLKNNPISCTCDTIVVLDKLMESGVTFPDRLECYSPKEHIGKSWQDVRCRTTENDLLDDMIGDVVDDGSGDVDAENATVDDSDDDDEKDYLIVTSKLPETTETNGAEGSGDSDMHFSTAEATTEKEVEGSGDEEPIVPKRTSEVFKKVCIINCSTPKPFETNSTATPPNFINGIGILYEDIAGHTTDKSSMTEETTSTDVPSTTVTTAKSDPKLIDVDIIDENLKNSTGTRGLERQLEEPNTKMSTTFMVVVGLLALMICLVAYSVYKRRQQTKRRRATTNSKAEPEGKELMPITKSPNNPIKEKVPLLNGQNGTKPNENDQTKSDDVDYTSEEQGKHENDDDDDDDYGNRNYDGAVQMRNNDSDNLLTPKMERVTIQERELSAPKTPILINRQFNDDGSITTTPTD